VRGIRSDFLAMRVTAAFYVTCAWLSSALPGKLDEVRIERHSHLVYADWPKRNKFAVVLAVPE